MNKLKTIVGALSAIAMSLPSEAEALGWPDCDPNIMYCGRAVEHVEPREYKVEPKVRQKVEKVLSPTISKPSKKHKKTKK